jgi:ABC-type amino acid transport substrate-binding protein
MRRLSIIILAVMLCLSLAACNRNTEEPGNVVRSPDDFPGAKIAVQTDTTSADILDEMIEAGIIDAGDVFRYEKVTFCFDDLKLNRVDAVFVDSVVAAYYMLGSEDFDRVWIDSVPEPMGICLNKDAVDLAAAIEAAIDTLYYNGKIAEIAEIHFGENFTIDIRNVTTEPVIPEFSQADLVTPGVLTVGSEVGYPPMEYVADDGVTFIGFDIDIGLAIAELLGLEHVVINTSWDGIFAGLEKGQYDCIISSVSITPSRQERYILTEPYIANAQCIVVRK